MNGVKFLLDTNVLIGLINRSESAISLLTLKQVVIAQCAFSAITRMELLSYHGLKLEDKQTIEQFLSQMCYLKISPEVEDATIMFRHKYKGKLPDAIIAATCAYHQLELLTLDEGLMRNWAAMVAVQTP